MGMIYKRSSDRAPFIAAEGSGDDHTETACSEAVVNREIIGIHGELAADKCQPASPREREKIEQPLGAHINPVHARSSADTAESTIPAIHPVRKDATAAAGHRNLNSTETLISPAFVPGKYEVQMDDVEAASDEHLSESDKNTRRDSRNTTTQPQGLLRFEYSKPAAAQISGSTSARKPVIVDESSDSNDSQHAPTATLKRSRTKTKIAPGMVRWSEHEVEEKYRDKTLSLFYLFQEQWITVRDLNVLRETLSIIRYNGLLTNVVDDSLEHGKLDHQDVITLHCRYKRVMSAAMGKLTSIDDKKLVQDLGNVMTNLHNTSETANGITDLLVEGSANDTRRKRRKHQ
jgi:hypothetical protein